jgi:hypothetical protein
LSTSKPVGAKASAACREEFIRSERYRSFPVASHSSTAAQEKSSVRSSS